MSVVQVLHLRLGVVLGPLAVDKVEPLILGDLVDLGGGQSGEGFLGEGVLDFLAFLALLLLPEVHRLEGGGPAEHLVRELGLVLVGIVLGRGVVDLVAGLFGLDCGGC